MAISRQSTVSVLVFGISLGTMGVAVLFIVSALLMIVYAVNLFRSKKNKTSIASEQLASINDPSSSQIDTERNVAYEVIKL